MLPGWCCVAIAALELGNGDSWYHMCAFRFHFWAGKLIEIRLRMCGPPLYWNFDDHLVELNGARFQRKPPKLPLFAKQCKRLLMETLRSCTVHVLAQKIWNPHWRLWCQFTFWFLSVSEFSCKNLVKTMPLGSLHVSFPRTATTSWKCCLKDRARALMGRENGRCHCEPKVGTIYTYRWRCGKSYVCHCKWIRVKLLTLWQTSSKLTRRCKIIPETNRISCRSTLANGSATRRKQQRFDADD